MGNYDQNTPYIEMRNPTQVTKSYVYMMTKQLDSWLKRTQSKQVV